MTIARVIKTEADARKLADFLAKNIDRAPFTVTIARGDALSDRQRRLSFKWYMDIARHYGDRTHGQVRAYCKLRHGIPIMRAESDAFRASYDRVFRPLTYEAKLAAIEAFELPVSSLMNVKQMTAYLDSIQSEFLPEGVRLTDPEALKYREEFGQ